MFEFLAPGPKPDSGSTEAKHRLLCQKSLAIASRTCRVWSKSALGVLWRVVDDPIPLLSLFPCFGLHGLDARATYVSVLGSESIVVVPHEIVF